MALTIQGILAFTSEVVYTVSFPIFCLYIVMVICARSWTKKTRPIELRGVLILYNGVCSVLSLVTLAGFVHGLLSEHTEQLYALVQSEVLRPFFMLYWASKIVELLDTVFMIVRHRLRQVTFLHVYHHGSMLLLSDYAYHHYPCPPMACILALNAFIHVVLYFYYALSTYDSSLTRSWKQRLTELQILQFLVDFVYAGYGYRYHNFCIYSLLYGAGMMYMFSNFYYHAYIKSKKVTIQKKE